MNKRLLNRRQFSAICATLGLSLPAGAMLSHPSALAADVSASAQAHPRTVELPSGNIVPAIGQGSWHLGQGRHQAAVEEQALRLGLSLGMRLIDTAENYGDGRSEELIGRVLAGMRDRVFLVTKVETYHTAGDAIARACEASLARLNIDYLDLYLLHWPIPSNEFAGVVAAFEQLRAKGKIRAWGVSNFNVNQMEDLFRVPDGRHCATNQIPYSLKNRGIERDLLPWCREHRVPVMAYSPLGGDNSPLVHDATLTQIGAQHGCSAAAIALAWVIRNGNVLAIPEAGTPAHVKENAAALSASLTLTPQELETLNAEYPGPFGAN